MRWFRSKIGFGSRLALFAMALQVALTFGHIHLGSISLGTAKVAVAADQSGTPAPNAPVNKSGGSADFDCPICALIQLASTATPAVAPPLLVPVAFVVVAPALPGDAVLSASPHGLFQARGPPLL